MYTLNLSNLESPHLTHNDDEYAQDFSTEIDYADEFLTDYADESYNAKELRLDKTDDDFLNYSQELYLSREYSQESDYDFEYDEVSISNDQILLENADLDEEIA